MTLAEFGHNNRVPRDPDDDYPTPPAFTDALLDRETFTGAVWEPAAGRGHMVAQLVRRGVLTIATDLRHGDTLDFLSDHGRRVPNVVTNPPYKHALAFARAALEVAEFKVALLVKATFLEGTARHAALFAPHPPARVYMTTRRMNLPGNGGGGSFAHCWVVWDHTHDGPTELSWFEPTGDLRIPSGWPA